LSDPELSTAIDDIHRRYLERVGIPTFSTENHRAKRIDDDMRRQFLAIVAEHGINNRVVMGPLAGEPRVFDDDIDALCGQCKTPIYHRPWLPKGVRIWRPPCAMEWYDKQ
jgi:hypothetical protein